MPNKAITIFRIKNVNPPDVGLIVIMGSYEWLLLPLIFPVD